MKKKLPVYGNTVIIKDSAEEKCHSSITKSLLEVESFPTGNILVFLHPNFRSFKRWVPIRILQLNK